MQLCPPPPPAATLGLRRPAGLGTSVVRAELDFETYSEAGYVWDDARNTWRGPPGAPKDAKGLPVVGAEPYVRHPTMRIIWMAYDLKDGLGTRQWRPGMPPPLDLFAYILQRLEIEAWNVSFERWVWDLYCAPRLGWPAVEDHQWRCAMAKARAFSLPGQLGKAGEVLQLPVQKDARGSSLMKRLSMPVKPTKADPRRVIEPVYDDAGFWRNASQVFVLLAAATPDATARKLAGIEAKSREVALQDYADTLAYGQYNATDVDAEAQVAAVVPDQEGAELAWWRTHERINRRGVHIDRVGVENCIAVVEQAFARYNTELQELCGIDAASKIQQLQAWLRSRGTIVESLDEEAVEEALKRPLLPPDVRRVLEIRAAVGSASIKKLYAIRNRLSHDGRLRDLYVYHAARTGRSTGEGPQPTNLPKAGPDLIRCGQWAPKEGGGFQFVEGSGCRQWFGQDRLTCPHCGRLKYGKPRVDEWNPEIAEQALRDVAKRSLEWVEYVYGVALPVIAGCLRALFDAAPGHDLISTDYNSIEAVGLAMIAGEAWRIKVFRTHGKIYEASASTMFGIPLEEILGYKKKNDQHHPLRQKGKVAELGFGYQGWVGAAHAFGMPGTDDEIKSDILAWRAASPAVEWLWGGQEVRKAGSIVRNALLPGYEGEVYDLLRPLAATERWDRGQYLFGVEGMAVLAMLEPDQWHHVTRLDGTDSGVAFRSSGRTLYCRIPSGRVLTYHMFQLRLGDRGGWAMSYEGWNTNPKNGPMGWITMDTWGGRLVENINQATCRDILAPACEALESRGYPVVLHVYDEIVAEVPEGVGSVEEFEAIVTVPPAWARDWPIRAPGGYRAKRYRKG